MTPISHSRPAHNESDVRTVKAVIESQFTAAGEIQERFAATLRQYFAGQYAATTSSGTLALLNAMVALDVRPNDEVILPTYVCAEVSDAVRYAGAIPVLCDIDARTYAPSAATVEAVLGKRTKAIIVPHMLGVPANVGEVAELGVPVVEDLAQGLGVRVEQAPAGARGDVAALSFKAIKMISAGEGGAVVARTAAAAECLIRVRSRVDPTKPPFEFPMSDLSAALAESQWHRLDSFLEARIRLATRYRSALDDLDGNRLLLPPEIPGRSWFRFPVTLVDSTIDPLQKAMAAAGVSVRRPVDQLLHRAHGTGGSFPVAQAIFDSTLSLPIYPSLTFTQQDRVIETLRQCIKG